MANEEYQEPIGPAVIMPGHVQDRFLSKSAGSKSGWSNLTIFERAYRAGKLIDRDLCFGKTPKEVDEATLVQVQLGLDRYDAGKEFVDGWAISNSGNWASGSDFLRVRGSSISGSFIDLHIDTKNMMHALERLLSTRDWMILRRVCGENHDISAAVTSITPGYRASTLARFRESLDSLFEMLPKAKRTKGR